MDKKRFFLFLTEHLEETYTIFAFKTKLKNYYSLQELDNILDILIEKEDVLQEIHNPYPTEICDDCGSEVELEKKIDVYVGFHRCYKIEKSFEEVEEYEINKNNLLQAISNDFGYKITSVEQAKIKLRRLLKEAYIYHLSFYSETNTLEINSDKIELPQGSKLAQTANIVSYCFEQSTEKTAQLDIEDNLFNEEFISSSNLAGDLSKLNQKILLETGFRTKFSLVNGYVIIR